MPGIYVDPVSGEALFASSDLHDGGTRLLNFSKPLEPVNITELQTTARGSIETEVRSVHGNSLSDTHSWTARPIVVDCVTVFMPRWYDSCRAGRWQRSDTTPTSSAWGASSEH